MKNILVIEDVEDHLEIVKLILEQHGYNILVATTGKEGLNTAKNCHPDLIILDVVLPEMNGYEVCKSLKNYQDTKDIPIIMLSVRSNPEDIETAYNSGANKYITKPFNLDDLINEVKRLLGENI